MKPEPNPRGALVPYETPRESILRSFLAATAAVLGSRNGHTPCAIESTETPPSDIYTAYREARDRQIARNDLGDMEMDERCGACQAFGHSEEDCPHD